MGVGGAVQCCVCPCGSEQLDRESHTDYLQWRIQDFEKRV